MNCKNCIHFEVCDSGRHIGEYIEDDGVYSEGVENDCATFKDKADYTEVVHGHWIDCIEAGTTVAGINVSGLTGYNCSVCGRYEGIKELYCNCGAKMDGGAGK